MLRDRFAIAAHPAMTFRMNSEIRFVWLIPAVASVPSGIPRDLVLLAFLGRKGNGDMLTAFDFDIHSILCDRDRFSSKQAAGAALPRTNGRLGELACVPGDIDLESAAGPQALDMPSGQASGRAGSRWISPMCDCSSISQTPAA